MFFKIIEKTKSNMERQRLNGEASNQLNAPYEFNVQELQNLSTYLREKVFEICVRSGSGHIEEVRLR